MFIEVYTEHLLENVYTLNGLAKLFIKCIKKIYKSTYHEMQALNFSLGYVWIRKKNRLEWSKVG